MTLRLKLAVGLAALVVGCSGSADLPTSAGNSPTAVETDPTEVDEVVGSPSESTPAVLSEEEISEREHLALIDEIVEAREAAWIAETESYSNPRSPDNPALQETLTGPKLLHTAFSILWNDISEFHYDDWEIDVQSIVTPEADVAWLETCLTYYFEERRQDGKVLRRDEDSGFAYYNPGYRTVQHTEEMLLTDDGWKLSLSIPNFHLRDDDDVGNCPIDTTGGPVSNDEIISLREEAEQQYIDALIAASHEDVSFYGGAVRDAIVHQALNYYYCPAFPALWSDQEDKLPEFYDEAWHAVYERSWTEREVRNSDDGHRAYAQPDKAIDECSRPFRIAHNPILNGAEYPATRDTFNESTTSSVIVDEVLWSDELPVAYMNTCRILHFNDASYGITDPQWGPNDVIVYATESMRLEDGDWVLTSRWNISFSEDVDSGCVFD